MGETIRLTSLHDGFVFPAYDAVPSDARRGGLLLIQEIFGVTEHIRELADGFAEDGYEVLAPALFERLEPGFEGNYDADGIARGREYSQATSWEQVAADLQACADALRPPVFAVGYCWGGAAAWLAACRVEGLAAASGFYGRRIPELLDETPRCPVILHFGKTDPTIPPEVVEQVRERHADVPVHLYDAGHGFVSDRRADYHEDSARLARLRTLQLFHRAGGSRGEV
jgi:carboxymethylenebutenolidase